MPATASLDHPALGALIQEAVALHDALAQRHWVRAHRLAQHIAARAPGLGQPTVAHAATQLAEALPSPLPAAGWKAPWAALVAAIDAALDDAEAA